MNWICWILGHVEFHDHWKPCVFNGMDAQERIVRCGRCHSETRDIELINQANVRIKRSGWITEASESDNS